MLRMESLEIFSESAGGGHRCDGLDEVGYQVEEDLTWVGDWASMLIIGH